jgi:hypothetical protein
MADQLMLSREQMSPIYQRLQSVGSIGTGRYQTEERALGQASIALGTTTDSYQLTFPSELKVRSEVLAVGHDSAGSLVQVAYAIAGSSLQPVTVTRGYLYSVRVRFVATDRAGKVVAALDTTRHFVAPAPVPDGEHLVGRAALNVPPGEYEYRLAIQQGEEAGIVLPRDTVRVGQPTAESLSLSDLVLGSRAANLFWRRTDVDTVTFHPLRTYKRSQDMDLYYEVEGLSAGTPYTVRIAVRKHGGGGGLFRKMFGGGSAAISLKFEEQGAFPVTSSQRTLKLESLKPGSYVLEVVVEDGQARTDRRSQAFQIVDEAPR